MDSKDKSKIGTIVSSIIIGFGCYAPWLKFGSIFDIRGIDGFDGAIVLILAVITGIIALYQSKQAKRVPTSLYGISGFIILVFSMFDIITATSKAKEMAESFRSLKDFINEVETITSFTFIGPGLFMVFLGSIGLMISAYYASIANWEIANEDSQPKEPYKHFDEQTDSNFSIQSKTINKEPDEYKQKVELLNSLMLDAKTSMFSSSKISEINHLLKDICVSKSECEKLVDTYDNLFKSDLISKLVKLSSSYEAKKALIHPFIEFGIVEENFPHERKML